MSPPWQKFSQCQNFFQKFSYVQVIQGPPYILDRLFNFLSFYHLSKRISKQMIHQLKGPIKGYFIYEKKWAWHHPGGGHAPLTEKALLLLKLVWSLPWQKFLQFQKFFQTMDNRVFFWGIYLLPNLIGIEMGSDQNSVKKTKFLQIY